MSKSRKKSGGARRVRPWIGGISLHALLAALAAAAVAPGFAVDRWRPAMALTYAPRVVLAATALILATFFLLRRRPRRALTATLAAVLLAAQLGWGGGARDVTDDALTVMTCNVAHETGNAERLARVVAEQDVDVLCLQEVQPPERQAFVTALPDYHFVWADEQERFEHDDFGPFSSMIGVRRSLLSDTPDVETAITGYRTFAARVELAGKPLWVVNVHTTKPLWLEGGPVDLVARASEKAAWHTGEREQLVDWLDAHRDEAVLVAGDFNAPTGSHNLRLPGLRHAQAEVGSGWHRTFPRAFPLWALDHVLVNDGVVLESCETIDAEVGDHLAVRVGFSLRTIGQELVAQS